MQKFVAAAALPALALANDNGLAITPPMGWRSWNLYGADVNQDLIETIMDGMVARTYEVDGVKTSLCDLGYCDVGLDDNWQACGSYGDDGLTYHDEDGNPIVNNDLFPDFKAMTDYAHSLGLTAGWYGNNCICSDSKTNHDQFYEGDVKAFMEFGFDSWKLDGCGAQTDMQLWDDLVNATGHPVMVENCHWGSKVPFEPNATWCPWNFYRTSGDVRASYDSVMGNLATVTKYAQQNLSYPGCWAYPDMLEVGCDHGPGGDSDKGLSVEETRSHFGAWAIVSSPLTLSHDVNNATIMEAIWPVISNREVIAVNQAFHGHSGSPFKTSDDTVVLGETNHAAVEDWMTAEEVAALGPATSASWQYLYKPVSDDGSAVAVLLMNSADGDADLTVDFADVPGLACSTCDVRDIWSHEDLGSADGSFTAAGVASHDAAFLVLSTPTAPLSALM